MAEKYYITNGNKVIGSVNGKAYGIVTGSIDLAQRFKYSDAINFLHQKMPADLMWGIQKMFNVNSGKNYIITNAINFAGNKGTITNKFETAKSFRSIADADAYIHNHRELVKSFGDCFIVNEKLETVTTDERKKFTDEQLEMLGMTKSSPRVVLQKEKRLNIYDKSEHRCSICGKPLKYGEMTIDHIVPLSRGGENSEENLRCVCEECNQLKGNRMDNEMYTGLARICARKAYEDPNNDMWNLLIRGKVRGTIAKYQRSINQRQIPSDNERIEKLY